MTANPRRKSSANVRDHSWTTGADPAMTHICMIDQGAFGEVHQVKFSLTSG